MCTFQDAQEIIDLSKKHDTPIMSGSSFGSAPEIEHIKREVSVVGLHSTEVVSVYGTPESPLLAHQGIGALLVYVIVGLWQARSHFATVGRRVWKGREGNEDADEIMSYRAVVLGLSGGIAVMVLWLWSSGIPCCRFWCF